jgi:hypothetical protein
MKKFLLSSCLGLLCFSAFSTDYFSDGDVSPNLLSSWNSQRDGSGSAPASFVTAGDRFVIESGDVMITTAVWTIGSGSSSLVIESGGTLVGNHQIQLTGTFQMDNGGSYRHNNTAGVSSTAGASIFGGTETFSSLSTFWVEDWINNSTPLPAGISWGNLTIDYVSSLGNWNQNGNITDINGSLVVNATGGAGQQFQLTGNTNLSLDIAGNLNVLGGAILIKSSSAAGTSAIVQVGGSITLANGTIDLGSADVFGNNELRFAGNFQMTASTFTSESEGNAFLVANGTTQSISGTVNLNANFRINSGSTTTLQTPISFGQFTNFIVAGTLNAGSHAITVGSEGLMSVSGGTVNSSANLNMQNSTCQICTGNGTFTSGSWCTATGTPGTTAGTFNYSTGTMQFNRNVASQLRIGESGSAGRLNLTNSADVAFTGTQQTFLYGTVTLTGNSTLDFSETSTIYGDANYSGEGGTLIISSPEGISQVLPNGNVQVAGGRAFDALGINTFEYNGPNQQITGDGLPNVVSGTLRVNQMPVTDSLIMTIGNIISGSLELVGGRLISPDASPLYFFESATVTGGSGNSYVDGPILREGGTNFTYPLGSNGIYSPLVLNNTGASDPSDMFRVEYTRGNPGQLFGTSLADGIERISTLEFWEIEQGVGTTNKSVQFTFTNSSGVSNPASLIAAYFDGSLWLNNGNAGITGGPTAGTLSIVTSNFGPFTLGSIDASNVLPINIQSFTARKSNTNGIIQWEVSGDERPVKFEVLASTDNRNFKSIGTVNYIPSQNRYSYTHTTPGAGTLYYRLKIYEADGTVTMTRIVTLYFQSAGLEILSVTPTISTGTIRANISSSNTGLFDYQILSSDGKVVKRGRFGLSEGTNAYTLDASNLSAGLYYLSGYVNGLRSNVKKIVVK